MFDVDNNLLIVVRKRDKIKVFFLLTHAHVIVHEGMS